jgi:gag-polypeptide of LTR copia-type
VFNVGEKIEEEDQAYLLMASLSKLYDSIIMFLLGKKSDLTMSEVTVRLLDSKSLRRH